MTNNITTQQNNQSNLKLLGAQRQLYTDAKSTQFLSFILTVVVIVVLAILNDHYTQLKNISALYSIFVFLLDMFYFQPQISATAEKAAKVQELFDCSLFRLEWNKSLAGRKPDQDEITLKSEEYLRKNASFDALMNWYPSDLKTRTFGAARLACQKINCWWDSNLRRRYGIFLVISLLILTMFIIVTSTITKTTTGDLGYVLVLLLPVYGFFLKQLLENHRSAHRQTELKGCADEIDINGSKNYSDQYSRDLQNEIYNNRKNNHLIPDFFYQWFRNNDESNMKTIAKS